MNDATLGFVGAIFGSMVGSYLSYRASIKLHEKQQLTERSNIAKAIDISFAHFENEEELIKLAELYSNEKQSSSKTKFFPMQPLYSQNDIYFAFVHDICKFDYKLSASIYQYFSDLIKADMDRQYIANNCKIQNEFEQQMCEFKLASLKAKIISCSNKIPEIRQQLKKIYEE